MLPIVRDHELPIQQYPVFFSNRKESKCLQFRSTQTICFDTTKAVKRHIKCNRSKQSSRVSGNFHNRGME